MTLILRPQELRFDHPHSRCLFQPCCRKPFVATPAALDQFGSALIYACLRELQAKAQEHQGLDYCQEFRDPDIGAALWFIEDVPGGAITALLPSDY